MGTFIEGKYEVYYNRLHAEGGALNVKQNLFAMQSVLEQQLADAKVCVEAISMMIDNNFQGSYSDEFADSMVGIINDLTDTYTVVAARLPQATEALEKLYYALSALKADELDYDYAEYYKEDGYENKMRQAEISAANHKSMCDTYIAIIDVFNNSFEELTNSIMSYAGLAIGDDLPANFDDLTDEEKLAYFGKVVDELKRRYDTIKERFTENFNLMTQMVAAYYAITGTDSQAFMYAIRGHDDDLGPWNSVNSTFENLMAFKEMMKLLREPKTVSVNAYQRGEDIYEYVQELRERYRNVKVNYTTGEITYDVSFIIAYDNYTKDMDWVKQNGKSYAISWSYFYERSGLDQFFYNGIYPTHCQYLVESDSDFNLKYDLIKRVNESYKNMDTIYREATTDYYDVIDYNDYYNSARNIKTFANAMVMMNDPEKQAVVDNMSPIARTEYMRRLNLDMKDMLGADNDYYTKYLTDDEINAYLYLYENDGGEKARTFLNNVKDSLAQRCGIAKGYSKYMNAVEACEEGRGLVAYADAGISGFISGQKNFVRGLASLGSEEYEYTMDDYEASTYLSLLSQDSAAYTSTINKIYSSSYDTAQSVDATIINAVCHSPLGTALKGVSAREVSLRERLHNDVAATRQTAGADPVSTDDIVSAVLEVYLSDLASDFVGDIAKNLPKVGPWLNRTGAASKIGQWAIEKGVSSGVEAAWESLIGMME